MFHVLIISCESFNYSYLPKIPSTPLKILPIGVKRPKTPAFKAFPRMVMQLSNKLSSAWQMDPKPNGSKLNKGNKAVLTLLIKSENTKKNTLVFINILKIKNIF